MVPRRPGVDPTERRIRELCLALSGTEEVEAWGHPNFKAAGKAFAALERIKGRPSLALRVASVDADLLTADERFFATPYGRGQWISLWLDRRPPWSVIGRLIRDAHAEVVRGKRPRR